MTFHAFLRALGGFALAGALCAPGFCVGAQSLDPIARRVSGLEQAMRRADWRMAQMDPPQVDVPNDDAPQPAPPPRMASDPSSLDVRVDRLENQMRTLNGQIEENQFAIRQLQDQLKKFSRDVDLRLQDNSRAPQRRTQADDLGNPPPLAGGDALPPPPVRPKRTADAFDPGANPDAPGAPRPLGAPATASTPLDGTEGAPPNPGAQANLDDPNAPLDLSKGASGVVPVLPPRVTRKIPLDAPPPIRGAGYPGPAIVAPTRVINAPSGSGPRDDYETAITYLRGGQYESAQTSFESFIQKYPRDRLVPDAVYYLGETYSQRGRHREAAEQYLKIATDYSRSARAPEGMLKLGMSLNAIGAKEQACATFQEVTHKYPNASASVRTNVDRELKRIHC